MDIFVSSEHVIKGNVWNDNLCLVRNAVVLVSYPLSEKTIYPDVM